MADKTFDVSILLGLTDEASNKFKTVEGRTEAARQGFIKAGAALTAFAVAGSIAIIGLTNKASNLEETSSKFNVVFEQQIDLAEKWSRKLVKSYGVSTEQSKRFLGSIQDLLVPMGMQSDIAARLSNEVVKLSIDLGSFNNMPTEKVMLDIQSALVGNFETMKKYGVVLNATIIEQRIMNQGLVDHKSKITQSMKAQAAYELIVAGSKNALGDFIRTSEGYANQVKIMQAGIEDLSARLGEKLLPTMKNLVSLVVEATKFLQDLSPETVALAANLLLASVALAGILGPAALLIGFLPQISLGIKQVGLAVKFATTGLAGWTLAIGASYLAAKLFVEILDKWIDRTNRLAGEQAKSLKTIEGLIKHQETLKEQNMDLFRQSKISQVEMFKRNALIDKAIEKLKKRGEVAEEEAAKETEIIQTNIRELETALQTKIALRQMNFQDAINTLNKELQAADINAGRRKEIEESITKFHDMQLKLRLDKITGFLGSVEGAFTNQIGMMIQATQTFGGAVQGMLDAVGAAMVQMIAKEAAMWITAQIAKATAGALAAHSAIPFVGIGIGLAAAGAIVAEINKAKAEANLDVGGITTRDMTANIHKSEAIIPLESPTAARMLAGIGGGGRSIIIQNNTFVGAGGLDDLVDIIEENILGRVQQERTV